MCVRFLSFLCLIFSSIDRKKKQFAIFVAQSNFVLANKVNILFRRRNGLSHVIFSSLKFFIESIKTWIWIDCKKKLIYYWLDLMLVEILINAATVCCSSQPRMQQSLQRLQRLNESLTWTISIMSSLLCEFGRCVRQSTLWLLCCIHSLMNFTPWWIVFKIKVNSLHRPVHFD